MILSISRVGSYKLLGRTSTDTENRMFKLTQMPTLGVINKVICDSLGLWTSLDQDINFTVPATEKERQAALKIAFEEIQRNDGTYGSLEELTSVTRSIAPKSKIEIKKSRTIQAYVNYLSKEDFSSANEFYEFKEYVYKLIDDSFLDVELSSYAKKYYSLSMDFYKELIREVAFDKDKIKDGYVFYILNILIPLLYQILKGSQCYSDVNYTIACSSQWPLKSFSDMAIEHCDVTYHRLYQFHEIKLNEGGADAHIWGKDFKGTFVNARAKQIVERLGKCNKIKWEKFYTLVKPLQCLLKDNGSVKLFSLSAFSSFISHNLRINLKDLDVTTCESVGNYPFCDNSDCMPVTDRIDILINKKVAPESEGYLSAVNQYNKLYELLRRCDFSLNESLNVMSTIRLIYDIHCYDTILSINKQNAEWIKYWELASLFIGKSDYVSALASFKKSLELAKYSSGPLYLSLYFHLCSFCKVQYKIFRENNSSDVFDRFFEPLGKGASSYSSLIGFSPRNERDPDTLMPRSTLRLKNSFIVNKIDKLTDELESKIVNF